VGEHAQQAGTGLRDERLDRSGAGGAHGGDDPAAGGQDVQVVHARHLHGELGRAVAAPDEVRVRVHEARHDDTAGGIQRGFAGQGSAQFVAPADGGDLFTADQHRAVLDDAQAAEVAPALRAAFESQELGGGMDEH